MAGQLAKRPQDTCIYAPKHGSCGGFRISPQRTHQISLHFVACTENGNVRAPESGQHHGAFCCKFGLLCRCCSSALFAQACSRATRKLGEVIRKALAAHYLLLRQLAAQRVRSCSMHKAFRVLGRRALALSIREQQSSQIRLGLATDLPRAHPAQANLRLRCNFYHQ